MPKYDIEALKPKIDIVKVISHYIEVTKKGNGYVALCPFHNDSNPSMSISPTKQIFNCFVCHTGGDAFAFISKYKKIPYLAAVKKACEICGVPCDIKLNDDVSAGKNAPLYAVMEDLSKYYEVYLTTTNGKEGYDYLTNRNISPEIMKKFRIGFAPNDPTLSIEMMRTKKNHSIDALINAGVLSSGSKFKDRYSGRIMFPITDQYGRVVGFSGRKINNSDESKYINSSENVIFHKGDLLYNYYESKDEAQKQGRLYLLEGFMDVIALTRVNIPSVGLMGTALTSNQIRLLKNRKADIYLALDNDDPGQTSSIHTAILLAKEGVSCKIIKEYKDAKDPDELLTKLGEEALIRAMNDVEEPLIHFAKYYINKGLLNSYDQKNKFIEEFLPLFKLYSPAVFTNIINDLVPLINLDAEAMKKYIEESLSKVDLTPTEIVDSYDDVPYIEGSFDFIDDSIVLEDKPLTQTYVCYGENANDSIYYVLEHKKIRSAQRNDMLIKKDEARIINLIRSSRIACKIISNMMDDVFHYDLVKNFYNCAVKFYEENVNINSLTYESLDKFIKSVPASYINDDFNYLVFVLHRYDSKLDNGCNSESIIISFMKNYLLKLKRIRKSAAFLNKNLK